MVSDAVTLFSQNQVPFAVRGGGYMALANAANIGPEGILIANTNFTTLSISNDRSSVKIGAGIKWPAVYSYLDEFKVAVNGIRIGDVGVVGFLIGGGIGFHSYEYGMASTYINYFDVCDPNLLLTLQLTVSSVS
jgi:FAD/FMN-containing dehydrogenase